MSGARSAVLRGPWVVLGEGQWCTGIRIECATAAEASHLVASLSRFGIDCLIVEKGAKP